MAYTDAVRLVFFISPTSPKKLPSGKTVTYLPPASTYTFPNPRWPETEQLSFSTKICPTMARGLGTEYGFANRTVTYQTGLSRLLGASPDHNIVPL